MADQIQLALQLKPAGELANDHQEEMILMLMDELSALPSLTVHRSSGDAAPFGAKGPAFEIASQVIAGISGGVATAVVPLVISTVSDWLGRQTPGTRLSITHQGNAIEISGDNAEAISQLANKVLAGDGAS